MWIKLDPHLDVDNKWFQEGHRIDESLFPWVVDLSAPHPQTLEQSFLEDQAALSHKTHRLAPSPMRELFKQNKQAEKPTYLPA